MKGADVCGKPVDACLYGAEVEIGVVMNAVDIEAEAESKDICAKTKVEAAHERGA